MLLYWHLLATNTANQFFVCPKCCNNVNRFCGADDVQKECNFLRDRRLSLSSYILTTTTMTRIWNSLQPVIMSQHHQHHHRLHHTVYMFAEEMTFIIAKLSQFSIICRVAKEEEKFLNGWNCINFKFIVSRSAPSITMHSIRPPQSARAPAPHIHT